jgi:polyhydroxyalkanoate synthesis regulator phasin
MKELQDRLNSMISDVANGDMTEEDARTLVGLLFKEFYESLECID